MTATYRSSWSDVWRTVARLSLLVVVLGTSIGVAVAQGGHPSAAPAHLEETASGGSGPIVRVSGNHLVNGNGVPTRGPRACAFTDGASSTPPTAIPPG
jgi:hypothetical protein